MHERRGVPVLIGFGVAMFSICSAIGAAIYLQSRTLKMAGAASESWPVVSGTISESGYSTRHSGQQTVASIHIRYSYQVGGQWYAGSTLAFEDLNSLSVRAAEQRLALYSTGASCEVFYDPLDPTRSVLEKGVRSGESWLSLVAIVFVAAAVFALYDGLAGAINVQRFPEHRST